MQAYLCLNTAWHKYTSFICLSNKFNNHGIWRKLGQIWWRLFRKVFQRPCIALIDFCCCDKKNLERWQYIWVICPNHSSSLEKAKEETQRDRIQDTGTEAEVTEKWCLLAYFHSVCSFIQLRNTCPLMVPPTVA